MDLTAEYEVCGVCGDHPGIKMDSMRELYVQPYHVTLEAKRNVVRV